MLDEPAKSFSVAKSHVIRNCGVIIVPFHSEEVRLLVGRIAFNEVVRDRTNNSFSSIKSGDVSQAISASDVVKLDLERRDMEAFSLAGTERLAVVDVLAAASDDEWALQASCKFVKDAFNKFSQE